MKFNSLLEFLQGYAEVPAGPAGAGEKKVKASTSEKKTATTPAAANPSEATAADSASAAAAAAERRAKMQAKLKEEERRDRARREKMAAKQAEAVAGGSKVDGAPEPVPPQDVEDGMLEGHSSAEGVVPGEPEPPVPPEAVENAAAGSDVEETARTVVHQEL